METKVIPAKTETKIVEVNPEQIVFTLDQKEAALLFAIVGNISGSDEEIRPFADEMYRFLHNYFLKNTDPEYVDQHFPDFVTSKFSQNITKTMVVDKQA